MIASTGSSGLYKAPFSKGLLLLPSALSILLAFLFQPQQSFFVYNLQAIKENFQVWNLIFGRLICLDLKDTFCSSLLIYNFRTLERRFGSRKFTSYLLGTWILSALFDILLVEAVEVFTGITLSTLPSGFLSPVFALFVPFYCSVPRVSLAHIFGWFPITNKTLVYIVGLQGGIFGWNRFFQPLRQRQVVNHAEPQAPSPPAPEQQVAQLMEMGFSRADVLTALRASNNDVNLATNFLLQR
ncbi:hypothetical protein GDO81_005367 [Engystomops pustulosus]|uniref:UBA domain-containing protein n=1 Tax=Engystomops pustulosus TaxID=76066 RepID=A0AAV7CN25_ENGPU|nr:hypothetical protein GDO81_005367 [Engystomops pustulosus]KAG8586429.1 hypothetical protein GDO81_005367 [Engystomops pustulosus]KAG8586430.1 hypothetical protein GDO81_005367 [Engystomops pustulosus]